MRSQTLLSLSVVIASFGSQTEAGPILFGSTNAGELVRIDVDAGTGVLIGQAAGPGWTDIAASAAGLLATGRAINEPSTDGCIGFFGGGGCTHLYEINPADGQIVQDLGSLGVAFVSDIDVADDGSMFGSYFVNEAGFGQGGLVAIDPATAMVTVPPNTLFGQGLENGGLAIDPTTGILWGIESNFAGSPRNLFQIDPATGLAMNILPFDHQLWFRCTGDLLGGSFLRYTSG